MCVFFSKCDRSYQVVQNDKCYRKKCINGQERYHYGGMCFFAWTFSI